MASSGQPISRQSALRSTRPSRMANPEPRLIRVSRRRSSTVPSPEARASSLPGHGDNEPNSTAIAAGISNQPAVVLQNLVKFFGRFAALRGVSASFAPGKLYVIVGDNGAGKSTLLRVIAGLTQASQGSVTLLGVQSARAVAHRIGYMGHAPLLYDELDGMENLRYFAGLYGLHDDT